MEGDPRGSNATPENAQRLAPTPEQCAQLLQALRAAATLRSGIQETAAAVVATMRRVQAAVEEAGRRATPVLQRLAQLQANVAEWHEAQARAAELLAPRGWLLPLSTVRRGTAAKIIRIAESDGPDAAERALMQELTPEVCRQTVLDLLAHPAFQIWQEHLLAALDAHEEGKYVLAIPVWLLVFDGVAHAQLNSVLRDSSIFAQMTNAQRNDLLVAFGTEEFWQGYLTSLVVALGPVGRTTRVQANPGLNRHVILHGRDPRYGTEKASVQCIVLLEGLSAGPI